MGRNQTQTYNIEINRPKVLLVGNGLTYDTSIDWSHLIEKISRKNIDVSKYQDPNCDSDNIKYLVPNTVLTLATSIRDDKERHNQYVTILSRNSYPENKKICRLLKVPFDAILTTNYTYEWEAAIYSRYPGLNPVSKRNYAFTTKNEAEKKYLLQTFNRFNSNHPSIWHIHGELRRPSSMILSHDEYARYISQIMQYNKIRGNDYEKYKQELAFKSWIDYFIMGDIYILGLSMDYAEFDLWWLLGRRLREKAGSGKIYFYEAKSKENELKQQALCDCDIKVMNCDVNLDNGGSYEGFYNAAIVDIESRIRQK